MGELRAGEENTCLIFFGACATIRTSLGVRCVLHCQNLPLHRQQSEMDHTNKAAPYVNASMHPDADTLVHPICQRFCRHAEVHGYISSAALNTPAWIRLIKSKGGHLHSQPEPFSSNCAETGVLKDM